MGCDIAQGFGIAHPMPFPDLRGWLTRWNEVRVETIAPRDAREGMDRRDQRVPGVFADHVADRGGR